MVDAPEAFFEELADAGLDAVSFHHEAVGDPEPAIAKARAAGMRAGVTLNLETPVEASFSYLEQIDDVMLMSIRPGWSGQRLNPDIYPRLEAVRTEIDRHDWDMTWNFTVETGGFLVSRKVQIEIETELNPQQ